MAQKKNYLPGQKYHRSADGVVRRCDASTRPCRYTDYDTPEEARSTRQRVSSIVSASQVVQFNAKVSSKTDGNLRLASNIARDSYARTGKRANSPLGTIEIDLPGNQKITLKRETYDRPGPDGTKRVGARYYMRYFPTPNNYEETTVELNNRIEYDVFLKKMDRYYINATENAIRNGKYSKGVEEQKALENSYLSSMQLVNEVEIMARGAEQAYKALGVDAFTQQDADSLTLNTSYYNSTLTPYDVMESLRTHAMTDDYPKTVNITISDVIEGTENDRWSLNRTEEGDWVLSANSSKGVIGEIMSSPEETKQLLGQILGGHKVPQDRKEQISEYASQMMREVEPSIKQYDKAVRDRLIAKAQADQARRERMANNQNGVKRSAPGMIPNIPAKESNKGDFAGKMGKLFGG